MHRTEETFFFLGQLLLSQTIPDHNLGISMDQGDPSQQAVLEGERAG